MTRYRIAIAGIAIESSAYAEHRADHRDFAVLEGPAVRDRYAFLAAGTPLGNAADWIGVFYARSIPGGAVLRPVYDDFRERILRGLAGLVADGGLDAVLLDVHGAMSVVGLDDAEGDLVEEIRRVIGPGPLIASPMDLHGNISERFAESVDLPTCYRTAPHEDVWETRERAARHLVQWLGRPDRPRRAWVSVPILLPGEKTSTRVEPAKGLFARLPEIEQLDGVTDASIWIGYAWADETRCHATVIVSGSDENVITAEAARLASVLWAARGDFAFVGSTGSLGEAVEAGLRHREAGGGRPYLISDSGDNPGAGGSGDVTWALRHLLDDPRLTVDSGLTVYVASIFDAEAVSLAFAGDVGQAFEVPAGARVDGRVSGPACISGVLEGLFSEDPQAGRIAVVRVGALRVILTEFRKAFHAVSDFSAIGLDPADADIIVTKIGYLEPTLFEIAQGWTLALTPGPVDQDLERLGHRRIQRPMFPFDDVDHDVDLTVRLLR